MLLQAIHKFCNQNNFSTSNQKRQANNLHERTEPRTILTGDPVLTKGRANSPHSGLRVL